MSNDLASVVVGAIAGIAATSAAGWIWFWYGASPRERAERRRAKWKERSEGVRPSVRLGNSAGE